jgi:hypothetical protein
MLGTLIASNRRWHRCPPFVTGAVSEGLRHPRKLGEPAALPSLYTEGLDEPLCFGYPATFRSPLAADYVLARSVAFRIL